MVYHSSMRPAPLSFTRTDSLASLDTLASPRTDDDSVDNYTPRTPHSPDLRSLAQGANWGSMPSLVDRSMTPRTAYVKRNRSDSWVGDLSGAAGTGVAPTNSPRPVLLRRGSPRGPSDIESGGTPRSGVWVKRGGGSVVGGGGTPSKGGGSRGLRRSVRLTIAAVRRAQNSKVWYAVLCAGLVLFFSAGFILEVFGNPQLRHAGSAAAAAQPTRPVTSNNDVVAEFDGAGGGSPPQNVLFRSARAGNVVLPDFHTFLRHELGNAPIMLQASAEGLDAEETEKGRARGDDDDDD